MSKNFVREIDGIKNINKQEFYTNKANDLLSTKKHNYIRKETQEYHCLTDNVKQTKATNVRYTDTTATPNVNYNLLSVDNSQVPKTNTNTISATSLVEALEAKDQQIKELNDKIADLKRESKTENFDGVLYTSTDSLTGPIDGFLTAKTITIIENPRYKKTFLVDFNFTGKLLRSNDGSDYHTCINIENLKGSWASLVDEINPTQIEQFITFTPKAYNNGLECPTFFNGVKHRNQLAFLNNGTQSDDIISTTTSFTAQVCLSK